MTDCLTSQQRQEVCEMCNEPIGDECLEIWDIRYPASFLYCSTPCAVEHFRALPSAWPERTWYASKETSDAVRAELDRRFGELGVPTMAQAK